MFSQGGRGASSHEHNKAERRNQSIQLRRNKRAHQMALRRAAKFGGPHVVAVVALSATANLKIVIEALMKQSSGKSFVSGLGVQTEFSVAGRPVTGDFPAYKKRITFIEAARDVTSVLDAAKVADTVIVVVPMDVGDIFEDCCDDLGVAIISTLLNQGVVNIIGVLQGLDNVPSKKVADVRKYGQRLVHTEFGDKAKAIDAASPRMILRAIAETPVQELGWRKLRSYFPAQKVTIANPSSEVSDVAVEGYLQGSPLSANQLIHVTGCGTFQIGSIKELPDPCPNEALKRRMKQSAGAPSQVFTPTSTPDLAEMRDPDDTMFAAEQTWPTAAEISGAGPGGISDDEDDEDDLSIDDDDNAGPSIGSGIPRGTGVNSDDDDDDDSDADSMGAPGGGPKMSVEEDAWGNEVEVAASERVTDMEQRRREERDDLEFPDEVICFSLLGETL